MTETIRCRLCRGDAKLYQIFREMNYYRCAQCCSLMLGSAFFLDSAAEKERYDQHNNDPGDPRYRNFVLPLVEQVMEDYPSSKSGLDFGCGPGPAAAVMLEERGYEVTLYDPVYYPRRSCLNRRYDYIICSEVAEHFRQPAEEFALMRSLLNPGGKLYCMTELWDDSRTFLDWHYKNDPTHLFFYHHRALQWICNNVSFSHYTRRKRLITFSV